MKKQIRTKENDNNFIIIIFLGILLLFSFGWGFGYMGGMMFFGPVFMVMVLVLIVWLIVSLTRER